MKLLFSAAVVVFATSIASAAAADDKAPSAQAIRRAADAFDSGRDAYKSDRFVEAAEYFEAADTSAPSSKALEFAIRSRQKAGQLDRAATLAELAQVRYPEDDDLTTYAAEVIAEAAGGLHRLSVTCDVPCTLMVGTSVVYGRPATERVLYLDPGEQEVEATWQGAEPKSETVTAEVGGESSLSFEKPGGAEDAGGVGEETPPPIDDDYYADLDQEEETPVEDEGEGASGGGLPPAVFWAGVGLTAVGIGVTTWSYFDTKANPGEDAIRQDCFVDGVAIGKDCETWKQAKLNELRTNIMLGTTIAIGVATVLIGGVATDWGGNATVEGAGGAQKHVAKRQAPSVQPFLGVGTSRSAMVGAFGRF